MYIFTTIGKHSRPIIQKVLLFLLFSCVISFLSVACLEKTCSAFYERDLVFLTFILTHASTEPLTFMFETIVCFIVWVFLVSLLHHTLIHDSTYSIKMRFLHWIFYFMKNLKLMISVKSLLKENKEYG